MDRPAPIERLLLGTMIQGKLKEKGGSSPLPSSVLIGQHMDPGHQHAAVPEENSQGLGPTE
jgi:hypothetical protein